MGKVDTTLFTKKLENDLFVLQIYVDDIIFGSTNQDFCEEFRKMMANEFEMSMIGELSYFLGLQIKQMKYGTFVSQGKYIKDMIKKFGLQDAKPMSTPMDTNDQLGVDANQASPRESHLKATKRILRYLKVTHVVGLWFSKGSNFELNGYSDSDYGGCNIDRMSTSGTCQLLGRSLVSWSSKKQNSVALSTAEAEYISADSCCAQLLWMKATLSDFGIKFKNMPLFCDNKSAIKMTQNSVQHSRTKHIDIRHHFIIDHQ
jgi:hypothetical protein